MADSSNGISKIQRRAKIHETAADFSLRTESLPAALVFAGPAGLPFGFSNAMR